MKKILSLIVAVFLVLGLASCKTTTSSSGSNTSKVSGVESSSENAVKKHVLKYLSWGFGTEEDNNLTRRMVAAYNKQSTTTRIELMVPDGSMSYDEFITTMAAGNNMPDVFLVNSVPKAVMSGWAKDIATITSADPEWNNVESALRDSITYESHVYAVPTAQNYIGFYANYDLINNYISGSNDAEDAFAPGAFTTDEWMNMVKDMKDYDVTDGTGVIGTNSVSDAINWMPSALDTTGTIKHFLYDGVSFDYKSDLALDAFKKIQELSNKTNQYVLESVPIDDGNAENPVEIRAKNFGSTDSTAIFNNGQMGFRQDGSWALMPDDLDFSYKFVGFPNAKVISAPDYTCISKSSAYPEEAYDFIKYLSFGEAGLNAKFDIIDDNPEANLSVAGLPISTEETVSSKWFEYVSINGLEEVFNKVSDGSIEVLVEGNKSVPGFSSARFNFATGISIPTVRDGQALTIGDLLWDVCGGSISINQYTTNMTTDLENRLNQEIDNAYELMGLTRK